MSKPTIAIFDIFNSELIAKGNELFIRGEIHSQDKSLLYKPVYELVLSADLKNGVIETETAVYRRASRTSGVGEFKNGNEVKTKTWTEFRNTGLFAAVNQFLMLFGWSITVVQNENGDILSVTPARVSFRGYSDESVDRMHKRVATYMRDNAGALYNEVMGNEQNKTNG